MLPREIKPRAAPGEHDPENEIDRNSDERDAGRESDRMQHFRVAEVLHHRHQPFLKSLSEDVDERNHEEQNRDQYREADENAPGIIRRAFC